MSSGMNTEQAKEYAKTMTYSEAVSNVRYSKGIKYRKATMIKLRELAEIADRLDIADTPQTEQTEPSEDVGAVWCDNCTREELIEPTTEDCSMVDCEYYKNPDYQRCMECKRKQTDCGWK